ncbi:uncharacterized protein LOC131847288 [Achroia grisella]|uniref:uncharacterized protein LOC131847288 n=1 Tax=Achroia grisella TaxID=688607 RepID=UPI0027D255B4|nr:uncharacterized protein LOC131847288 [Achroia grisella]
MAGSWSIRVIITLIMLELIAKVEVLHMNELPLTKSLGFDMRGNIKKTLEDAQLNRELTGLYQDVIKLSEESYKSSEREENRLRRIIGGDEFDLLEDGLSRHRRGRSSVKSAALQRRIRSQAIRREKLNSQGLRNHVTHTKLSVTD